MPECYVYIQLPGATTPVVCGKFAQETTREGDVVGRFVYGRSYRERSDAVPLDPFHLPLRDGIVETAKLGGIFGALRDAAPDAWGRRVIERVLGRTNLSELEFLLESAADRAGALSFGLGPEPPAPPRHYNRIVQLAELRRAAALFEAGAPGEAVPPQVRDLLQPGTSLGGARPKNVVEDDDGLWIAKFPQTGDRWNNAPVELAMLRLAGRCGIHIPVARVERVGADDVLLVKRFDRERALAGTYLRYRMVSALTVLDAGDAAEDRAAWSYVLLADELRRWSARAREDRRELFRRMVFNALISNSDDHPRNHALIAPGRDWRLAPAFDLTPNPLAGAHERYQALICGRFGRAARRDNLVSEAPRFGLRDEEARACVDEIKQLVGAHWQAEIRRAGGNSADCATVAPAFDQAGFEFPTQA